MMGGIRMNKILIDNLFKQAEEAHKVGNYIKEKNAYKKLYTFFKRELGKKNKYTIDVYLNSCNFL